MSLEELEKELEGKKELLEELRAARNHVEDEIDALELKIKIEKIRLVNNALPPKKQIKINYKPKNEIWFIVPYKKWREEQRYVLTNLKDKIINSKHTYEGRPCAVGWAVSAFYVEFDKPLEAIELLYKYPSFK